MDIPDMATCTNVASSINVDLLEGFSLPPNLTPELFHKMEKVWFYYKNFSPFAQEEGLLLSCSEFFKDLLLRIDERLAGSRTKFVIYSGHETTLMAVLPCMGLLLDYIPPYGSLVIFELYSDMTLDIIYND